MCVWEDLRQGMSVGIEKFMKKKRFLPDVLHAGLPHQLQISKDVNVKIVLKNDEGTDQQKLAVGTGIPKY